MKISVSEKRVKSLLKKNNILRQFINYYDVFGNKNEGYEVNNLCYENIFIIGDNFTEKELISFLKKIGYLQKRFRFTADYNDEVFYSKDYFPMGRLETVEKSKLESTILSHNLGKEYISTFNYPIGRYAIVGIAE